MELIEHKTLKLIEHDPTFIGIDFASKLLLVNESVKSIKIAGHIAENMRNSERAKGKEAKLTLIAICHLVYSAQCLIYAKKSISLQKS